MVLGGKDVLNKISVGNIHDPSSKPTQDDQVTSAPKAVRVSIKTAVWIVLKHWRSEMKNRYVDSNPTCEGSLRYGHPSKAARRHTRLR